jgi:hypothetical protein
MSNEQGKLPYFVAPPRADVDDDDEEEHGSEAAGTAGLKELAADIEFDSAGGDRDRDREEIDEDDLEVEEAEVSTLLIQHWLSLLQFFLLV